MQGVQKQYIRPAASPNISKKMKNFFGRKLPAPLYTFFYSVILSVKRCGSNAPGDLEARNVGQIPTPRAARVRTPPTPGRIGSRRLSVP